METTLAPPLPKPHKVASIEKEPTAPSPLATPLERIASIDIVRALTMVLMIFVNDLGSLRDIPLWLEHVERGVDGIGLADTVFPAFLFIVGLSLPFAINNRRKKGDTDLQMIGHILFRTVALLVMGVFLVNGETYNQAATGMPRWLWNPICCTCFILIWNSYPKKRKTLGYVLRGIGVITLIVMAYIYRGGGVDDAPIKTFAPSWWGILGLIGWSYLAGSLVTLFSRNRFWPLFAGFAFFAILSMAAKAHLLPRAISFIPDAIRGGTLTGLVMAGALASFVFQYYRERKDNIHLTVVFLISSGVLIGLSMITRPYWKLAKLGATPAWLFLCSAFTLLAFLAIYWIADVWKKEKWFNFVRPAGTDTLLCYLIPYFMGLLLRRILHIRFPEWFLTGGFGLTKSLLLALFCVGITYLLNRRGVKLKL
jgi:predicted acyltransferase